MADEPLFDNPNISFDTQPTPVYMDRLEWLEWNKNLQEAEREEANRAAAAEAKERAAAAKDAPRKNGQADGTTAQRPTGDPSTGPTPERKLRLLAAKLLLEGEENDNET